MAAASAKPSIASAVIECLFGILAGRPVQLDNELSGNANEIGNVGANWHHSPEFPSGTAVS